jgi:hypothetical protein
MKRSLIVVLGICLAAATGAFGQEIPLYELATADLPDLNDGSLDLEDWEDVLPGTALMPDSFEPMAYGDGAGASPADFDYKVYLAWNSADQRIWAAIQRVDDVYINTYEGGNPPSMWQHDGIELMLDGDHTAGSYNGFSAAEYGEEQAKLLSGYQAQQFVILPESPDGQPLGNNTAASGWVGLEPWGSHGGSVQGEAPTTSVIEFAITAWDALDWHGPEVSTRSTLEAGRIIGFNVSVMDWDVVGTYHAFHNLNGLASTWREADNFVDGDLIGCEGGDCGAAPATAVESTSWGRVKASLK